MWSQYNASRQAILHFTTDYTLYDCVCVCNNKEPCSSGQLFYAAVPGEQLGVQCVAQEHLSRCIESGESIVHSLLPSTIPAGSRLKPATVGLRAWLSNH